MDFIKHDIQELDEIYNYQEELETAVKLYI